MIRLCIYNGMSIVVLVISKAESPTYKNHPDIPSSTLTATSTHQPASSCYGLCAQSVMLSGSMANQERSKK